MSEKKHSFLSASGAHRWLACPASALLEQKFPDTSSEAAAEGTLAHELAELKLRHYFHTVDFGRQKYTRAVNKLKKGPLWQSEMEGYTDDYLEFVKATALEFESTPSCGIEKRVYFGEYTLADPKDRNEGYGTADCVLIGGGVIHVIDFKYGKGVAVSAEGNPQLALYALGAYEAYKVLYPIETVRLSIIQPRIAAEPSTWETSIQELMAWGDYVKSRAELARSGTGDFQPGESQCRFCRAKAQCRARADANIQLAFETQKKPPLISNEEVGDYLQKGEDVAKWLKDLQDYALAECLAGRAVPGWKAVEGRGSREWTDADAAFEHLIASGTPEEMLYEKKPLTLAQVEKLVGKTEFAKQVGVYVTKNPGKPALVKETDKREAITNKITAKEAFKEETA